MKNKRFVKKILTLFLMMFVMCGLRMNVFAAESSSGYTVTVPKKIVLEDDGRTEYEVSVEADSFYGTISVEPDASFIMSEDAEELEKKADIVATVEQTKTSWTQEEFGTPATGSITTEGFSSGDWKGKMNFSITSERYGYLISVNENNGSEAYSVITKNLSDISTPTRAGYEFAGWYISNEENIDLTMSNPNSQWEWTQSGNNVWTSCQEMMTVEDNQGSEMISNEFTLTNEGTLSFEWRYDNGTTGIDKFVCSIINVSTGITVDAINVDFKGFEHAAMNYQKVEYLIEPGTYQIKFSHIFKEVAMGSGYTSIKNLTLDTTNYIETAPETFEEDMTLMAKWDEVKIEFSLVINNQTYLITVPKESTWESAIDLINEQIASSNCYIKNNENYSFICDSMGNLGPVNDSNDVIPLYESKIIDGAVYRGNISSSGGGPSPY